MRKVYYNKNIINFKNITVTPNNNATTTTSLIYMTIQAHTVLQKIFLGIKITTQGNYVTLIIICHEHHNKLKYSL